MYSVPDNRTLLLLDCSIRISPDQSLYAAPRGFSQLATSFFACWCQGILHVPFVAWPPKYFWFWCLSWEESFNSSFQHFGSDKVVICLPVWLSFHFPYFSYFFICQWSPRLQISAFFSLIWWAYLDLNQGPRPYQGRALTNWAIRPIGAFPIWRATLALYMVELKGLEPLTFCLQSRCSSQLS